MKTTEFHFPTLEHAWAGLNEFLANNQKRIEKNGGGIYGTEMVLYDAFIAVDKAWISPDFDFSHILGYTIAKWTKLISNYVDRDYLDLVKAEVQQREKKKSTNYTHSYHFSNKHGGGKDCLISLIFQRTIGSDSPSVIYHTRAMECTKRAIFDFLLIQKIVEYVYGPDKNVNVKMYIPFMFIAVEGFLLYNNYKPITEALVIKDNAPNPFQARILAAYQKFNNIDPETIKYRVHKRSALGLQKGLDGKPLHGRSGLLAGKIELFGTRKVKHKDVEKLDKSLL